MKDETVVVEVPNEDNRCRQVPKRLIRKVVADVPESLQSLNIKMVEREAARYRVQPEWQRTKRPKSSSETVEVQSRADDLKKA